MNKRGPLLRLLGYIRPYRKHYLVAIILALVRNILPLGIIWIFGESINILNASSASEIHVEAAWDRLLRLFFAGLTIALVVPIPAYIQTILTAKAINNVIKDIRCDLYAHIQKLSHSFFDASRSGSLTSRIMSDVQSLQPFLGRAVLQVITNTGMILVVLIYLFSQSWVLGLLSVCLVPLQILVIQRLGIRVKVLSRKMRTRMAGIAGDTQERLAATTIVKTFTQEADEVQRFSDESDHLVNMGLRRAHLGGLNQAFVGVINMVAPLLVILIGGRMGLFHPEKMPVGLLVQFVMMQNRVYQPFLLFAQLQMIIADALGSTDRIFEILDTEPEVADRPGSIRAKDIDGSVTFDHVTFTYPQGDRGKSIDDLSLEIPARTSLALVGPSGGGKSTLGNLLNRFYEVDSGTILLDGRDITGYKVMSLRFQIGLVPQDPVLFTGTLAENILYGRPGATHREVRSAASDASALAFIEDLPDGFDTLIGERGLTLSGGQKQRVAIARAFLKDPAILILDEATSALDLESERYIQEALSRLMQGRTTMIIAHRLSTVMNADQIAVIENGKVVEIGKHQQLLDRNGLYASLYETQLATA